MDAVASIEPTSNEILNKSENKVKAEAERVDTTTPSAVRTEAFPQSASCSQLSDNAQLHLCCDVMLSQNALEDSVKDSVAPVEANCQVIPNNSENNANAEAERVESEELDDAAPDASGVAPMACVTAPCVSETAYHVCGTTPVPDSIRATAQKLVADFRMLEERMIAMSSELRVGGISA
mmetsp:Transcript_4451/g.11205  ORF Transcript_4451/g.11205 Transcript_4451/m.11205 type:complete len:179 (+) Transcript_4451:1-537(+)